MRKEDLIYLKARANAEIVAAQAAKHPKAAEAHTALAHYYLDRVHGSEPQEPVGPDIQAPPDETA